MKTKRKKLRIIGLILLVLLCAACILMRHVIWVTWQNMTQAKIELSQEETWDGGTYTRVSYGEDADQYIDLYVPSSAEPVPLFVLVHGGGFVSGDAQTRQAQFMYRYFRDHGFACASVNYRLAQKAKFPAAVEDVRAAVHMLSDHAAEYGFMPDHFAIWGESAGGYLAAYEALCESGTLISALVDFYGVMDFPEMDPQFRLEGIPKWMVSLANGWVKVQGNPFESMEEFWVGEAKDAWTEELLAKISVNRVALEAAQNEELQTLILHGDADITVPYHQSEALARDLREVFGNDRVTYHLLHGLNHASDLFYTNERLGEVEAFIRKAAGL